MKVAIVFDTRCGHGHKIRSRALSQALRRHGHQVLMVKDDVLRLASDRDAWDWIVLDLPRLPSADNLKRLELLSRHILNLNGQGHIEEAFVEHNVIQGFAPRAELRTNTLIGPEYVIVRPQLRHVRRFSTRARGPREQGDWLVYGGGGDEFELATSLARTWNWGRRTVHLLGEPRPVEWPKQGGPRLYTYRPLASISDLVSIFSHCSLAIVHFGMIAWELAVNGIPTLALWHEQQGPFVMGMVKAGWIVAPSSPGPMRGVALRSLVAKAERFAPQLPLPDGRGDERLIEYLESQS